MKKFRRILAAVLAAGLCFSCLPAAHSETIYDFPSGIEKIESEAFSDTGLPEKVFIPKETAEIAPDAFADPENLTVYGFTGSEAERYAGLSGASFVSVDIASAALTAPEWTSPYVPVIFSADAVSGGHLTYEFTVFDGEAVIAESGETDLPEFSHTFRSGGEYSASVVIRNKYAETEAFLSSPVTVAEPIQTAASRIFLSVGESADIVSESETRVVTMEVSDESALSVSGSTLTAQKYGTYSVTLKAETAEGTVYTIVPVEVVVPPESVIINSETARLIEGASMQFTASVLPEDAEYTEIIWSVSDETIASVDENGLLTARKAGSVYVYASCANVKDVCAVTVTTPVSSISIDSSGMPETVYSGMKFTLRAETEPDTAYDPSVTWHTSNKSIASIDPFSGTVTALDEGEATVTATANDKGGASARITFTVLKGIESISFDSETLLADPGETISLSYETTPDTAVNQTLIWESSDTGVAEVRNGVITCIAPGTCRISAQAVNGVSATLLLTVAKPVTGVESVLSKVYMNPGTTLSPLGKFVFISPSDTEHSRLTWVSDNPDIVHADEKTGLLSAINTGTAHITASAHGGKSVGFIVQVVSDAKVVSSVSLSSVYGVLTVGDTGTVTPTLSPSSKYTSGTWYSDDESILQIVSVDSANRVTVKGVKAGVANLHYIASSGVSAVCPIAVNPVVARTLTINASSLTLNAGDAFPLAVSYQPGNATATAVKWTSSNPKSVEVTENGLIYALKGGTGIITALCEDGAKATCTVTVNTVPMTEASLVSSHITMNAGETTYAEYTFMPENSTPAAFAWTSGNREIVSAEALTGRIRALNPGNATVTATALDGSGLRLTLNVTVTETPIEEFSLSADSLSMSPGETQKLTSRVLPSNASYSSPSFSSSDANVASVDFDGNVYAVSDGECVITVTVGRDDYMKSISVPVTVEPVNDVTYRALIMGQFTNPAEDGYLPFANNGTKGVKDALSRSVIDGHKYNITRLTGNPTPASIASAINNIAAEADENDVTVIFYLTHGGYSAQTGYLMQSSTGSAITPQQMITTLKGISGHVVFILCTCNSGRIFESSIGSALYASGGVYQGKNGEGRLSILCASTNTLSSYYRVMDESASYDFYSYAVTRGLGWNMLTDGSVGSPLADKNGDGKITVSELASFTRGDTQRAISAFIQKYGTADFAGNEYQFPRWKIADGDDDLVIFAK